MTNFFSFGFLFVSYRNISDMGNFIEFLHLKACWNKFWAINAMSGWNLKVSRMHRLQLALDYLKFDEIERCDSLLLDSALLLLPMENDLLHWDSCLCILDHAIWICFSVHFCITYAEGRALEGSETGRSCRIICKNLFSIITT